MKTQLMNRKEILARIKDIDAEAKETVCARECLAGNGCHDAVHNANEKLKRLDEERRILGRMVRS